MFRACDAGEQKVHPKDMRTMSGLDGQRIARIHSGIILIIVLSIIASAGCGERQDEGPFSEMFPGADAVEGVIRAGEVITYGKETLYDYLNGGAELYFDYDIVSIASREYELPKDSGIEVSIYDMSDAGNAFGIYSIFAYAGADRADIGNDAIRTPATLDFWKGRYYCKLMAYGGAEGTEEIMDALARYIADRIPEAGTRPDLVGRLPEEGRIPGSEKYFVGPLGLNNIRYVASENVLALGDGTEGAVAEYGYGDMRYMGYLIAYPGPGTARAAFETYTSHISRKAEEETSRNGVYVYILEDGSAEAITLSGRHIAGAWDVPPGGQTGFIERALASLPED